MDVRSTSTGGPADESRVVAGIPQIHGEPRGETDMGFAIGNVFAGPAPDRIPGIDPGLRCSGYAVIERTSAGPYLCEGGVIRSTRGQSLTHRVQEIAEGFADVIT